MEEPPLREAGVGLLPVTAPLALLTIAGRHRFVLSNLVRREVRGRYRNAALGYGWTVLEPALLAVVYWFLFIIITFFHVLKFKQDWRSLFHSSHECM